MENISIVDYPGIYKDNNFEAIYKREMISRGKPGFNPVSFSLATESGKNLFHYIKRFNLSNEDDLVILYPNNHFYYDESDLKKVRTLINLEKLNLVKDPDIFLQNLFCILPPDINFIGCFSDSKNLKENGFLWGLSTRFNNFLDLKTDHNMNKKDVSKLLEKYGFKVLDMTEMNGLTYFYSKNVLIPLNIRD